MTTRLGRFLGRYQEPALVFGTSSLVKSGQRDYGAISAAVSVVDKLASQGIQYEPIILDRIAAEYKHFFDTHTSHNWGIPVASAEVVNLLDPKQFPPEIRDMIGPSRELWRTKSRKAQEGEHLDGADLDLLTFVNEQAENGRECFVFTYDEDEYGPVEYLESRFPNVHYAKETLQPANRIAEELKTPDKKDVEDYILLYPNVVGQLYGMESTTEPTHYLLAARVPIAGEPEEIGISIHPLEGRLRFEEGDAFRYLLLIVDTERLIEAARTSKHRVAQDQLRSKYKRAFERTERRFISSSIITPVKSKKYAIMSITRYTRKAAFSSGDLIFNRHTNTSEWIMIDNDYLRRFSPETLEHLRDFRRRFPR